MILYHGSNVNIERIDLKNHIQTKISDKGSICG